MHPGLLHLLRLQLRSFGRRWFRGLRTWRGFLFGALGMGVFAVWIVSATLGFPRGREPADLESLRTTILPAGMLVLTLLHLASSASQTSVRFTPAEVDFLFCSPFSRREILAYKLLSTIPGLLVGALMFSLFMSRVSGSWISGVVGFLLALLFVQLLAMSTAMLAGTLGELAYNRSRKAVLLVVALAIALAVYQGFSALPAGENMLRSVAKLGNTTAGQCLLLPYVAFARAITAPSLFPDLVVWGSCAALIDALLAYAVFKLDANFLEAETTASRRLYDRLQKLRRSGGTLAPAGRALGRIPTLPRLAGAGPIVRRQLIAALRGLTNARRVVFMLLIATAMMAALLPSMPRLSAATFIGPAAFLTIFCTRLFSFDFRNDLDHLDWLKSMPASPWAVTCGQLVVPTALVTLLQWTILGVAAASIESDGELLVGVAAFALPFNLMWFAMENAFFLAFPIRATPATAGSFQYVGRDMVGTFVKLFVLAMVGGVVAGVGAAGYFLPFGSPALAMVSAWMTLAACALAFVRLAAWGFRRFDVATETPA